MMEAAGPSEKSVNFYQTTRNRNVEGRNLHSHCRGKFKSELIDLPLNEFRMTEAEFE